MEFKTLLRKIRFAIIAPYIFVGIAVCADIGLYFVSEKALAVGVIGTCIMLAVAIAVTLQTSSLKGGDIFVSAREVTRMQHAFLRDIKTPLAIVGKKGDIIWKNKKFESAAGVKISDKTFIFDIFPEITETAISDAPGSSILCEHGGAIYRVSIMPFEQPSGDNPENTAYAVTFQDETLLSQYRTENRNLQPVVGIIYIDNYEEVTRTVDEMQRTLMIALIDRRVNRYFSKYDALVKKMENDKYFVVFRHQYIKELTKDRFSILEDVRSVKTGSDVPVTLSIGLGDTGLSYNQNFKAARECLDIALGRGGAQVVLRADDELSYYGAGSRKSGSTTRVKARVKAQALREILLSHENIMIMGHNITDEDSFGAAIGMYCAARNVGRKAHIVIDSGNSTLRPIKELFTKTNGTYDEDMFYSPEEAPAKMTSQTALIIVDTARPSITVCPELIEKTSEIVVFDHHRRGSETIENASLSYIEPYASSASEMVAEVLQYFDDDVKVSSTEATAIYAGIVVDTNNFARMTGTRTFEAAAYLKKCGADGDLVHKLLRNDLASYKAKAEALRQTEIFNKVFAISAIKSSVLESPTIACAQAANEMLNIVDVKASFVMTDYKDKIYISARSIDEVNVQIIMERLGGGGHLNTAGAQLEGVTLSEANEMLKSTLETMVENGDIIA